MSSPTATPPARPPADDESPVDRSLLLRISDDVLRHHILSWLLVQAEEGGDQLKQAGFTDLEVTELRGMTLSALTRLTERCVLYVNVFINAEGVMRVFRLLQKQQEQLELMIELIRGHAPIALLRKLFDASLDMKVVNDMQNDMILKGEMPPIKRGRPTLPPLEERDRIHAAWHQLLKDEPDDTRRWIRLRREHAPEHDYATLYAVINEFDQLAA